MFCALVVIIQTTSGHLGGVASLKFHCQLFYISIGLAEKGDVESEISLPTRCNAVDTNPDVLVAAIKSQLTGHVYCRILANLIIVSALDREAKECTKWFRFTL